LWVSWMRTSWLRYLLVPYLKWRIDHQLLLANCRLSHVINQTTYTNEYSSFYNIILR
jgi:hypothetical protein